jgi:two-component system, OmpR family, alkaline phosphatase synthesis response regulator PhoP
MTRAAVVALTEESASALCQVLRRQGIEAFPLPAVEAVVGLLDLAPDVALIEFSGAARALLDSVLAEKTVVEQMSIVAVLEAGELFAYETGGASEDFALWPCPPEELAARLRLAVRRRRGTEPEHIRRYGDLVIDIANYRVSVAGKPVELTFKEYELLRFLAANRDKVFTREALLNRVWGYDYYGGARTVDVHIRRLRAKIEDGHRTFIETIRNVGYRFSVGTG